MKEVAWRDLERYMQPSEEMKGYVDKLLLFYQFTHQEHVKDYAKKGGDKYFKGTLGEFIHSIKISQGSLEELSGDCEDCREDGLITDDEFNRLAALFQSAGYMSTRYLESLYKMEREGTWKVPGSSRRKKK